MKLKIYLVVICMVLLVSAFGIVSSADYKFQNSTGDNLTVIHGDTGNLSVIGDVDVGRNVTASWFRGIFNWIIGVTSSNYLSFNGTQLNFNEATMNTTIDTRIDSASSTLNVNSSDYWDGYDTPSEITSGDSELLDSYDSSFFMPLNTSVVGDFDWNGGWSSGGLSISGGDLYAQTGYFYNITGLDVNTLKVNGSLLPQVGFDNQFDVGSESLRWRDLYLGGEVRSNGTGNNYFLGNVGIGTGSPDALLDVNGSASDVLQEWRIQNAGVDRYLKLTAPTASSSTPFIFDTNNELDFRTDGVSRLHIDENMNVGIGTTSPSAKLEVVDNLYIGTHSGSVNPTHGLFIENATGYAQIQLYKSGASVFGIYNDGSETNIGWGSSQDREINLINSGVGNLKVGINTTSPDYALDVAGDIGIDHLINHNGNSNTYIAFESDRVLIAAGAHTAFDYDESAASTLNIDTGGQADISFGGSNVFFGGSEGSYDGNVGIGTTSPTSTLEIVNTAGVFPISTYTSYDYVGKFESSDAAALLVIEDSGSTTNGNSIGVISDDMILKTAGSERVRIDNSGNVGIGTTSPGAKLEILNNTAGINNLIQLTNTQSSPSQNQGSAIYFKGYYKNALISAFQNPASVTGGDLQLQTYSDDSTLNTGIYLNRLGNVGIGTTSPVGLLNVNSGAGGHDVNFSSIGGVNLNIDSSASSSNLILDKGVSGADAKVQFKTAGSLNFEIGVDSTPADIFKIGRTNNNADFVIDTAGNVGIGITAPGDPLDVNGTLNLRTLDDSDIGLRFMRLGTTYASIVPYSDDGLHLGIRTDDGKANNNFILTASGNVNKDHDHLTGSADPTFIIHSSTDPDTSNVEWGSLSFNGTGSGGGYLNISNGVGDIVLSPVGNVGIGTASPSYKLNVVGGDIAIDNNEWFIIGGTGVISRDGNGETILRADGGNEIVFKPNSTEAMRIDSSGNVGIGTTAPTDTLFINKSGSNPLSTLSVGNDMGTAKFGTQSGYTRLFDGNDLLYAGSSSVIYNYVGGNVITTLKSNGLGIGASPTSSLTINSSNNYGGLEVTNSTGGSKFFVNASSGNVGIGTTSPNKPLHVESGLDIIARFNSTDEKSGIVFTDNDGDVSIGTKNTDEFFIDIGDTGTDQFLIDSSGNVGIGETSPSAKLHVLDADKAFVLEKSASGYFTAMGFNGNNNYLTYYSANNFTIGYGTSTGSPPTVNTMTFSNTGNVGIGTVSPGSVLDIYDSTATSASTTGTTLFNLTNYVGADLQQQKSFIDFNFQDDNANFKPQVRIGAEVGENGNADTLDKEGSGGFVIYTAAGSGGAGAGTMTEKMRVDYTGNVGIGTTTPANLLNVLGDANVTGDLFVNGANITGDYVPYTGATSNLDLGANNLSVNTNTLFVDSNGGNVGIGTTSPGNPLHIYGSGNTILEVETAGTGTQVAGIEIGTHIGTWEMQTGAATNGNIAGDLGFLDNDAGLYRVVIKDTGNVGMGTTGPNATLEIINGTTQGGLMVSSDSQGAGDLFIVDEKGKVGVGTTNPEEELHIKTTTDTFSSLLVENSNGGTASGSQIKLRNDLADNFYMINHGSGRTVQRYGITLGNWSEILAQDSLNGLAIGTGTTDKPIVFGNNNLERMRIDAGGNVGIGYSNPGTAKLAVDGNVGIGTTAPSELLHIKTTVDDFATLFAEGTNSGTAAGAQVVLKNDLGDNFNIINHGSGRTVQRYGITLGNWSEILAQDSLNGLAIGTGTIDKPIVFGNNNLERMRINAGGNVGIGTTSPSDLLEVYGSNSTIRISDSRDGSWTIDEIMSSLEFYSDDNSGSAADSVRAAINLVDESNTYGSTTGLAFYTKADTAGYPTERLRIDASGKVGIGTVNPQNLFNVLGDGNFTGNLYVGSGSGTGSLTVGNTLANSGSKLIMLGYTSAFKNWQMDVGLTGGNFNIVPSTTNGGTTFSTAAFSIDTNGNVGIGTTTPNQLLQVAGNVNITSNLTVSEVNMYNNGTDFIIEY